MAQGKAPANDPDLTQAVVLADLVDGKLVGHVNNEEVLLVRAGSELFAIGAHCTHYHGPLAEGLVTGSAVRCPWHHACFDLRSGEALRAPALSPVECWKVEQKAGQIFVKEKREQPKRQVLPATSRVRQIVIIGGGAAGFAAAEMLRRRKFDGSIVILSKDASPPVDRPNLSKDYLAGNAPEDWVPLRPHEFYAENNIELHLSAEVVGLDANTRKVTVASGKSWDYDRLLLATGAEPVRLQIPGADQRMS
jgi:nitrite reductase/ring-hydroxylating ferredoxin subunit